MGLSHMERGPEMEGSERWGGVEMKINRDVIRAYTNTPQGMKSLCNANMYEYKIQSEMLRDIKKSMFSAFMLFFLILDFKISVGYNFVCDEAYCCVIYVVTTLTLYSFYVHD